ncbi:MipA/OmpV family protein [Falsiroseomonas oryziterrae]|uniref:MipA/OmpV family protein n=1 Tax=Falsiroseomonas oryziterrae TaxID=2911368 RepID=UPI001F3019C9|nr:MipA/OmpV family protein [Roseomonas sp. NPKOSM-4]
MRSILRAAAALLPCLLAAPAVAQTGLAPQAAPAIGALGADNWRVAIGVGALLTPDYLGSNDWTVRPLAAFDIRTPQDGIFISFRDGAGATLLRNGPVSAGVLVRPRFGRDQDDNDALRGMGDVDLAGEAGAFVSYSDGTYLARAELRQGFGGHSGVLADARLDRIFRARPDLILSAGPRLSWGSRDFAETYFGVDERQSQRSGYEVFRPRDYWFAGVAAGVTWVISDRWAVIGFGEVGRIFGDAADSPLVDRGTPTQAVAGLTLTYRFWP